jgi:hypothetical protein
MRKLPETTVSGLDGLDGTIGNTTFSLSDNAGGGPPGGRYFLQAFSARSSAGRLNGIPITAMSLEVTSRPPGNPTPPPFGPARGSGKPETPLARMHRDIAAGEVLGPCGLDEPQGLGLAQPHATIATAKLTAVTAIDQVWRWLFGSVDIASACSARSLASTESLWRRPSGRWR